MKRILLLTAILMGMFYSSKAQYFETGQDPASLRWKQINTANFQLIYPEEFENQAQRLAYVFEKVYAYSAENLQAKPKKISIVVHTSTVKSNGLVAWAPKRVELFTTPHQEIYAQDWLEQLAIHEFTHVMQLDQVQQQLPGIFKLLLGEQAAAAVVGLYLPFWLIEGDAVTNETACTATGRGRLPSFLMENKAQIISKGVYSLSKAYHGSYKDFVPDHYKLGYWFTGKAKTRYGTDLVAKTTAKAAKNPFSITPLSTTLKKSGGLNLKNFYTETIRELKSEWQSGLENSGSILYPQVSPQKKIYTSYVFARYAQDNYFALRQSLNDIPRIVSVDTLGKEQIIATPGSIFEESFSSEQNLFIWSENKPDLRWAHSDRSVICIFDRETGKTIRLRTENKVFSPKIAPNKQYYAAIETNSAYNCSLSVFDLKTGKRLYSLTSPDNQYFFTPCWNEDSNRLFFVALGKEGKYLASWQPGQTNIEPLGQASFVNIKSPAYFKGKLYFTGGYTETNNIYCIDLTDASCYQVTNSMFGADYASVSENGQQVLFSNYTSDGYHLATLKNDPSVWKKVDGFQVSGYQLANELSKQVKEPIRLEKPDSVSYSSKRYSKIGNALNIHSWAPLFIDPDNYEFRPGVSIFSQDKLGTTVVNLGYDYEASSKTGKFVAGIKYSGWYPVIKAEIKAGRDASKYYLITTTKNQQGQVVKQDTTIKRFTWGETNLTANMYLPFNLSSGRWSRIIQPEMNYEFTNVTHNSSTPSSFFTGNYQSWGNRIYFHSLEKQSYQDIQSNLGIVLDANYSFSPFGNIDFGKRYSFQSSLYLPGLMKNHGIKLYNAVQNKDFVNGNAFNDQVRFPRGYHKVQNTRIYSFAADYKLPLLYPDISIGKLAYIKRLRASIFYDYSNLKVPVFNKENTIIGNNQVTMNSFGIELLSDLHLLRFFAPVELGVRSVYRPDYNDYQFSLLFSIDFSGF